MKEHIERKRNSLNSIKPPAKVDDLSDHLFAFQIAAWITLLDGFILMYIREVFSDTGKNGR